MKNFLLILLVVQLSLFTVSLAQITFTREWVTGKRSASPKLKILMHEEDEGFCKSLLPAIDYLLEVEKVHQKVCGSLSKSLPIPIYRKPGESNSDNDASYDPGFPAHLQKSK